MDTYMVSIAGGSMKLKCQRSLTPRDKRCKIVCVMSSSNICGRGLFSMICIASRLHMRTHTPGWVRPARPALCAAFTLVIETTSSLSTRRRGLYCITFSRPESTT